MKEGAVSAVGEGSAERRGQNVARTEVVASIGKVSHLYGLRLDHERELALANARTRRHEARVLELAGDQHAAEILRLAARIYDDSARFWEQELQIFGREQLLSRERVVLTQPTALPGGASDRQGKE
jgi:hypothetical protein